MDQAKQASRQEMRKGLGEDTYKFILDQRAELHQRFEAYENHDIPIGTAHGPAGLHTAQWWKFATKVFALTMRMLIREAGLPGAAILLYHSWVNDIAVLALTFSIMAVACPES
uniref:Uncharacterized protein n=1 Tax=Chromera velia CCMP2878 TaxID=1169474 RepID=A0A0G4I3V9_9ALVE|eukprot:Cvel_35612.t1-p1 / transcript=Cvel_35612.t1 / gene=Cvel_35612 / organism=Chromera_velia_CCMP2878 / gene_product=hypothetical protein / transcript_product=hypothetical protein / location=Cvel_scaffold6582:1111-1446(+) / protein_length=112 / sequence_SO=supercontig / SO=protein_coding / is_pseudo=false